MEIACAVAVVVTNDDIASRQGVVADFFYLSIGGGHDGCADGHGPVGATVRADAPRYRMGAPWVKAGAHAGAALKGVAAEGWIGTLPIPSMEVVVVAVSKDGQI